MKVDELNRSFLECLQSRGISAGLDLASKTKDATPSIGHGRLH